MLPRIPGRENNQFFEDKHAREFTYTSERYHVEVNAVVFESTGWDATFIVKLFCCMYSLIIQVFASPQALPTVVLADAAAIKVRNFPTN